MCWVELMSWQDGSTAPKDGSFFLANAGYPWPVVACYSNYDECFVIAELQIAMVDNVSESYFENTHEETVKAWMPMPELNHGE